MDVAFVYLNKNYDIVMLVRSIKMFVGNANNLEIFCKYFGASFVFKVFSNFAFKNILEKIRF
jgi:hypothetical protein